MPGIFFKAVKHKDLLYVYIPVHNITRSYDDVCRDECHSL